MNSVESIEALKLLIIKHYSDGLQPMSDEAAQAAAEVAEELYGMQNVSSEVIITHKRAHHYEIKRSFVK